LTPRLIFFLPSQKKVYEAKKQILLTYLVKDKVVSLLLQGVLFIEIKTEL
jgi:hypothetical protein